MQTWKMWATTGVAVLALGALASGCDSGDDGGAAAAIPTEKSLSADVVPVVRGFCGACHKRTDSPSPDAVANGLYFETAADLLGLIGTGDIVPSDGAGSPLIQIMDRTLGAGTKGELMPPAPVGPMPKADVAVVKAWIDQGAQDN